MRECTAVHRNNMINILCLLMRVAQTVNSLHLRLPGGAAGARDDLLTYLHLTRKSVFVCVHTRVFCACAPELGWPTASANGGYGRHRTGGILFANAGHDCRIWRVLRL
jgi:hypothetical protein